MVNYTSGGLSGGYLKYLKHMVPLMRSDGRVSDLEVFVPEQAIPSLHHHLDAVRPLPRHDGRHALELAVTKSKLDVVFIPTARWINLPGVAVVSMVRNMEPLTVPVRGNSPGQAARNIARRAAARQSCLRANRVIAVSQHVRSYLERRWRLERAKIGVVYHGVQMSLEREHVSRPADVPIGKEPLIFAAGSIRPARGLEDALGALALLQYRGVRVNLMIAGEADSGLSPYAHRLRNTAHRLGIGQQVTWAGQLSEAEMGWCYRACDLFLTTSRAEACPNTVLEAMSYGCVSVSTDREPMPEFFGDSALYYRSGDPKSLAEIVERALSLDASGRRRMSEQAQARARGFEWSTTARRTVDELAWALT